jgi:cytochrome c553
LREKISLGTLEERGAVIRTIRILSSVVLGLLSAQQASAQQQSAMPAPADMAEHVAPCAPCHGAQGEGSTNPYFPRLAAKPAGYLLNQLLGFQQGRRHYAPMNYLLEFQRPDYLAAMAAFFAAQQLQIPPQPPPTASAAVLAHGEDLVEHGAPSRSIPACSACHGARLTGMEPAIPGLLALNADYITAQLGAWRYGTRTATAPDCMQQVAGRLTDADITAVAAWLSSRPLPANAAPLAAKAMRTPLPCGSAPQ